MEVLIRPAGDEEVNDLGTRLWDEAALDAMIEHLASLSRSTCAPLSCPWRARRPRRRRGRRCHCSGFGFHSRTSLCAFAICAEVISAATVFRMSSAFFAPLAVAKLSHLYAVTLSFGAPRPK